MSNFTPPPDQQQRRKALDPSQSILVQAPAGSGKTDLLTRRFLRLLAEVEDPGEIVAITFTNAAAAEMRQRILGELEKAAQELDAFSPAVLKGHGLSLARNGSSAIPALAVEGINASEQTLPQGLKPINLLLTSSGTAKAVPFQSDEASCGIAEAAPFQTTQALSSLAEQRVPEDPFAMESLARRALARSQTLGWNLVDLPAQLRITTIDAFCRELALQQPLLGTLGGALDIAAQPEELYRRAARATLRQIDGSGKPLAQAVEALLLWRDNGWQEMEDLLVAMLSVRDRWMHGFVLEREPHWEALRRRLERPFRTAAEVALHRLDSLFAQMPPAFEEALWLARFACAHDAPCRDLAERPQFPRAPFDQGESLEEVRQAYLHLADFLLTKDGSWRKTVNVKNGFPADKKQEKARFSSLLAGLGAIDGLEAALAAVRSLPPAGYSEDDWQIVRACFVLLRHAAGELQIAFAEAGAVDFTEISQMALRVLRDPDGLPTDAALAIADKIRHILVDEFQDTSRRQHQLLASLVAAWPERPGRTCFAVGDPMQSIYFFRDADAELFARVKNLGLEIPSAPGLDNEPLLFDFVPLLANFRTESTLVAQINALFQDVFAQNDGSGISFSAALPAREPLPSAAPRCALHLAFAPQTGAGRIADPALKEQREAARAAQIAEIIALIQDRLPQMERARAQGGKFRIALLGRTRTALAPIAEALRAAQIPFQAVDLEQLRERPEVLDALALARALASPLDRIAWLGLLRAPWCGLSLAGLHRLAANDDPALLARPIAELLEERLELLTPADHAAASRLLQTLRALPALRAALPTASLGTWLKQVWLRLGGAACVDAAQRANLDLLWSCLDALPNGEQELLGPTLDSALDRLTALPDPAASADCGVQLMTIHKSKGLEFEVVIVPELQARAGGGQKRMLSWLERGLAEPDESGEITEFLIAPLQPRGEDAGKAKAFVDRAIRQRESQEMRRILYVASTRAREELHFFACPAYKTETTGELQLVPPTNSLLATAWPALEAEVRARFDDWKAAAAADSLHSVAAAAESNLMAFPAPPHATQLRRLPQEFSVADDASPLFASSASRAVEVAELYQRHEGGLSSRALGTAVHSLLEEYARLRGKLDEASASAALDGFRPVLLAQMRSRGLSPAEADLLSNEAFTLARNAVHDPIGAWILSPHPHAASEARWTGSVGGALRTVQADRVFRAGPEPLAEGQDCWWIVDYKTAHAESAGALPALRTLFAPQLASYAAILRDLHGREARILSGLYYPRMGVLDWWEG